MIATNSPRFITKSVPRNARTGAFSASNVRRTPRTIRTSSIAVCSDIRTSLVAANSHLLRFGGFYPPCPHGRFAPLDTDLAQTLPVGGLVRQRRPRCIAQHRRVARTGHVLQALRKVHRVADDGVLDA